MSERYIFNKKLNRSNKLPYLLLGLLISVGAMASFQAASQVNDTVLVDPAESQKFHYRSQLQGIDFHRLETGGAEISITFNNGDYQLQLAKQDGKLVLTLPEVELGADQLYTLELTDFATPVLNLETFQDDQASHIEFNLNTDVTFTHQRQDNVLVINVDEALVAEVAEEAPEEVSPFTGEPISLDFQDVPVRQVLQIIAQVNGFNLVTTDTVSGNITINLSGVPWDQALAMILKIKGLDKRMEGNIMLVAPSSELTARETQELQSQQQVAELAPLMSANIQINYAKAADMATILKTSDASILSSRGSVTVDERTNTLLIKDTEVSINEAKSLIKALDIPIKQVLIESRMVTVRDNIDEQFGVRWGFSGSQNDTSVSGTLEGADSVASGVVPDLSDRLNVNLPVSSAAGSIGLQVAKLANGTILDLELSALESENKGEVIASPRITVANQHEAYIEQGTEIPYVQATSSGATSVEFKKAVLSLKVVPHITPDNRIILDLTVTQDTRGETVSTSTGDAVSIDTQEISTQVLVENGETIVLGGIFQQTSTKDVSKVPLLGDLPGIGFLFRNSVSVNEKRELLIFVTPKILTDKF